MKYILFITVLVACCLVSCNDWLDVRPETEQKDKDQFSSVNGFYDALIGCYMTMADNDAYGERLSMSNIESLANLWYMPENTNSYSRLADWELTQHTYTTDNSRAAIKAFYGRLFSVIAQANMILKHVAEQGDVFVDTTARAVVEGEAYALRAYCQFDLLRLFGQMPQNPSREVMLPYSFGTGIHEMPAYYDDSTYVALLEADLTKAEALLKGNDPLFEYSFKELYGEAKVADNHLLYRQTHLNYWAVKALQARLYLYRGRTQKAYQAAKEVIDAIGPDGKPVMTMSGPEDFAKGYKLCPSECLFYLSKYDVMTHSETFLIGGREKAQFSSDLVLSGNMFNQLYSGENQNSHNRYKNCWNNKISSSSTANAYVATTKYYFDDKVEDKTLYYQLVPMLRMSEVYLIAMETAPSLSETNSLYKEYMVAHEVGDSQDFASPEEARQWIHSEYPREFIAEGQAFYTYKRTAATKMLRDDKITIGENDYILPLPETEYNPNNLQK